jgi:uncharacterized protein (TIGR03435 family)
MKQRPPLTAAELRLTVLMFLAVVAGVPHWIAFAQKPEFEVASVKLNTTNGPMQSTPVRSGDLITMHNVQVYSVIFYAYHLTARYQMVDYPDLPQGFRWWDIDARIGRAASDDEVRLMLQSLLENRFKLRAHRETKEMTEYQLSLGKAKPKLDTSPADTPLKKTFEGRTFATTAGHCGTSAWLEGLHLVCHSVDMEQIAKEVGNALEAPAADRTGLTGAYDLDVLYMTDEQRLQARESIQPAPAFVQAFADTTGLKIDKGKGPADILVIDHLEKATANK